MFWNKVLRTLHGEFKVLLGIRNIGGTIIFVGLFVFIVFNNCLGLVPYVFTSTSHIAVTLRLALPL